MNLTNGQLVLFEIELAIESLLRSGLSASSGSRADTGHLSQ